MALVWNRERRQYGLESQVPKDPQGVCFREAFKWLAGKICNLPRRFEQGNAPSVLHKQQAYLQPIQPFEGRKAKFETFSTHGHRPSQQTLHQGGNKHDTTTGAPKYRRRSEG